jgi:hypothetical protein
VRRRIDDFAKGAIGHGYYLHVSKTLIASASRIKHNISGIKKYSKIAILINQYPKPKGTGLNLE